MGSSSLVDTFATRLSAQPLSGLRKEIGGFSRLPPSKNPAPLSWIQAYMSLVDKPSVFDSPESLRGGTAVTPSDRSRQARLRCRRDLLGRGISSAPTRGWPSSR